MKKAVQWLLPLLGRVIFIGLSIQIVLGIVWMCLNFAGFQEFGDSFFYVQVGENLICDEYTGILYPVFLRLVRGVEKVVGLPFYYAVYAVQLLIGLYAAHSILSKIKQTDRLRNLWGSLAILTLPMSMQCHLAVLPNSLASSFFFMELGACLELLRTWDTVDGRTFSSGKNGIVRETGRVVNSFIFWLLCALLMPEYLYLAAVPVAFVLLYGLGRMIWTRAGRREAAFRTAVCGVLTAAAAGVILAVFGVTQAPGYYGRAEKSPEAAMVSRFAWTSLQEYYNDWPEELRGAVDFGRMRETSFYPDNIEREFGPLVEKIFGAERAKEYFVQLSKMAWERNKRKILHETAWDAAGYTLAPLVLQMQLTGRAYDSYSGRNYEIMRQHTPILTRIYMDYSCWWFGAGLCVTAAAQLLLAVGNRRLPGKKTMISVLLVLFSCSGMILWYTLRGAGMMDYKLTVTVGCLWCLWSVGVCLYEKGIFTEKIS